MGGGRIIPAFIGAVVILGHFAGEGRAGPVTVVGSQGDLSASATFAASGTNLIVTLTNTSSADVLAPMDVLTAVFFNLTGNPALGRVSAVVAAGSTVLFGTTDPGGVVGGEWAYKGGGSAIIEGASQGISSVGLGPFGPGDRFPGTDLQPPDSPDGLQYGITSAGDDPTTGNTPVTGENALIQNSVVFTLSGLPDGFDPMAGISNVWFQYGTDFSEPRFSGTPSASVPEPSAVAMALSALVPLGFAMLSHRRRRRRADTSA